MFSVLIDFVRFLSTLLSKAVTTFYNRFLRVEEVHIFLDSQTINFVESSILALHALVFIEVKQNKTKQQQQQTFTLGKTPESGQEQYDENVNLNTELKLISSSLKPPV